MKVMRASVATALAVMLCLVGIIQLHASEELTRAKELYRSASYDEALTVLDSIRPSADTDETIEVHQFRVLCLVALDRKEDAKQAMAALIIASPEYQLSEEDASPRVRSLFAEVRRSVMPTIVQRAYADAKTAFDRKDPTATAQFDRVLTMLKDPDVAKDPSLSDLATVVSGFRDLSAAAASAAAPVPTTPSAPAAAATVRRPTPSGTPAAVVAPVAISQVLPPMPLRDQREWDGEVEVTVNAAGKVTAARMTKSIHPAYDSEVLRAAKAWTYKPATRDGVPTQMLKLVTIHIDARPPCGPRVSTNCRPASE
jgi:TonB family protein